MGTELHIFSVMKRREADRTERGDLLRRYYKNATYNAAFERCIDIMTQMIHKYGEKVLELQENQSRTDDNLSLKNMITPKNSKAA